MKDSASSVPTVDTSSSGGRLWRSLLFLTAGVLIVGTIFVMTRSNDGAADLPVSQGGGLKWESTVVHRGADGVRLTANLELDGKQFPTAGSGDDQFVMYQLAGGRFDTEAHSDDLAAEKTLGFDKDDNIHINPVGAALQVNGDDQPRSGEYTLSTDGSVEYTDLPTGTWQLRAYVMDNKSGTWTGAHAVRSIVVP